MQQLVNRKFWNIYFNAPLNILEVHWKRPEDGAELEEEEFKPYLFELADLTKDADVHGFLVDARAYHLVMGLDFQRWHDEVIIPKYIENAIKNIVFILDEASGFVEAISVEQTFEEQQALTIKTHFKDSLETARAVFF